MKNEDSARRAVLSCLETLKEAIGGEWPLSEAFTDLEDHPEQDEDGGFNYNVGYVTGLCEAFGWDVVAMCLSVEPDPPVGDSCGCAGCDTCGSHCVPDCPSGVGEECGAEPDEDDLFDSDLDEDSESLDSVADQANDEWE